MIERLFDRVVTIVPTEVTGTDAHGNDTISDGTPIPNVPAARDPLAQGSGTTEELEEAAQQNRTFVYFLPAEVAGVALEVSGHDRIVDSDGTFEIRGPVDEVVARRRGKIHHLEAVAYWQG